MMPILIGPLATLLADAALLVVDALDEAGGLVGTAVGGTAVGATLDDALDAGAFVGGAAVGTGVGAGAQAVITTRATSVTRTKMFRIFWFIFSSPRFFCACLFEQDFLCLRYHLLRYICCIFCLERGKDFAWRCGQITNSYTNRIVNRIDDCGSGGNQ